MFTGILAMDMHPFLADFGSVLAPFSITFVSLYTMHVHVTILNALINQ